VESDLNLNGRRAKVTRVEMRTGIMVVKISEVVSEDRAVVGETCRIRPVAVEVVNWPTYQFQSRMNDPV
jgi:hypothetical protein